LAAPLRVRTPGKVNLTLLVGPRRGDGYHKLLTVFVPVGLYDELIFELEAARLGEGEPSGQAKVSCPGVPPDGNLVSSALSALALASGWELRGLVTVRKHLPVAAGMGGGSSNAAAALKVGANLIEAAGGPAFSGEELRRVARELGADVPFFLDPRPCLARGVGELMEALRLPPFPLVLTFPDASLSTAEVYRTFDGVAAEESRAAFAARARRSETAWRSISRAWESEELILPELCAQVAGLLFNDLEQAAFHLLPELLDAKVGLERRGVLGALVSGSGPTVFGLCASEVEAETIAQELERDEVHATWVSTLAG